MNTHLLIFACVSAFCGFVTCIIYLITLLHSFSEKKLYKKPFYNYTSSEIMKKYGITESEYLLLKEELEQRRLFNYNDNEE